MFDAGWPGELAAALACVWFLNLFNFMDGIDGIAAPEAAFVAFAAAWLIRQVVHATTLATRREHIDGLAVVNLVVFAVAIMDGVTACALQAPAYVAMALAAAFVFNLLLQSAGYVAFRRLGRRGALTVAFVSGNCNMGLVLVALQGRASFEVTVFFALAQIPMYTLPAPLAPTYRRLLAGAPGDDGKS